MVNEIADVVPLPLFHRGDNAYGLVQRNKHKIFFITRLNNLTIHFHHIAGKHLSTHRSTPAVDKNISLFDVTISIAARADAALANVFVETNGGVGQHSAGYLQKNANYTLSGAGYEA
ncbi:hypothetical protein SRABI106_04532 [Rahnella aquatilis]|nr:hypothetical protein SRABI106_04532 [Rahnella aquatilis]